MSIGFSVFTLGWKRRITAFLLGLFVAFCLAGSPLMADDDGRDADQILKTGEVVPLDRLLARIRQDVAGRILKVELEHETDNDKPGWIYEAKVLTPEGHVLKLEYDAQTLELLVIKGRHEINHHEDDD